MTNNANIGEYDFHAKNTIEEIEQNKQNQNLRKTIINPEVEVFMDRLLSDAKQGIIPFNDSSLINEEASKHFIYYCLFIPETINQPQSNINEKTIQEKIKIAKKLCHLIIANQKLININKNDQK